MTLKGRAFAAVAQAKDRAVASDGATWRWTAVLATSVFLLTAHWQTGQSNDAQAAIWPAWQLAHAGTFDLSGASDLPTLPWFHEVDGRIVSDRTVGVILAGVPFALLAVPLKLDPQQAGALAAAVLTGLSVANLHVVLRSVVSATWAAAATAALALGTPLWTTAAAELWTHGPDAFWISLALLAASRGHLALSGLAFAGAIMTRPHLAMAAAAMGLAITAARRSLAPALQVGLPAAAGVAGVVAWNAWYFQNPGIGGGTYGSRMSSLGTAPGPSAAIIFLQDVAGAFLSPAAGLLVYSPVIALALALTVRGWRRAPVWARGAWLGAVLYQVVQLRLNRYTGGGGFYSNRLVTEFVILSAPLWVVALRSWALSGFRLRLQVLTGLATAGIAIHAFGALNGHYWKGTRGDWYIWYPSVVLDAMGPRGYVVAGCLAMIPLVAVLVVRSHQRPAAVMSVALPASHRVEQAVRS